MREAFAVSYRPGPEVWYRANNDRPTWAESAKWKPSIHMPRWASRITLEVTDVRVQRVREITLGECAAEGAPPTHADDQVWDSTSTFRELWDSINAARGYPWESNPWVFAVTFKLLEVVR